jgi:hypothetical protein
MVDAQTCLVRTISSATHFRVLKLCMTTDTEKYITLVKVVFLCSYNNMADMRKLHLAFGRIVSIQYTFNVSHTQQN